MGLDGALREAFYVLGQHLLLVAVGCICLGASKGWSASGYLAILLPCCAAEGSGAYSRRPPPPPALPWLSPGAPPPSGGWVRSPPGSPGNDSLGIRSSSAWKSSQNPEQALRQKGSLGEKASIRHPRGLLTVTLLLQAHPWLPMAYRN